MMPVHGEQTIFAAIALGRGVARAAAFAARREDSRSRVPSLSAHLASRSRLQSAGSLRSVRAALHQRAPLDQTLPRGGNPHRVGTATKRAPTTVRSTGRDRGNRSSDFATPGAGTGIYELVPCQVGGVPTGREGPAHVESRDDSTHPPSARLAVSHGPNLVPEYGSGLRRKKTP